MIEPQTTQYGPFAGIVKGLSPTNTPTPYAQDAKNVVITDASIRPRPGYAVLSAAPSGHSAQALLAYVAGNQAGSLAEELLSIETRSGNTRPYSVNPTTGVRTEITEGGVSQALTPGVWECAAFEGRAIVHRRGAGSVYAHTIGQVNDWELLDQPRPADATAPVLIEFEDQEAGEEVPTPPTSYSWAGLTAPDVTNTGGGSECPVAFDAVIGNDLELLPSNGGILYNWYGVKLDLTGTTAGALDLSAATDIILTIERVDGARWLASPATPWGWSIGSGNAQIWITNDVATEVELENGGVNEIKSLDGTYRYELRGRIPVASRGAGLTVTEELRLKLPGNGDSNSVAANRDKKWRLRALAIVAPTITPPSNTLDTPNERIRFGYAPYDSRRDVEAENVTAGAWLRLEAPNRYGADVSDGATFYGNKPTLSADAPGVPADSVRWYYQRATENIWRLIATRPVAEVAYTVTQSKAALDVSPERVAPAAEMLGSPEYVFAHAGSAWYLYNRGTQNVRVSNQGVAERLNKPTDDLLDTTRGATWTLADNASDAPMWGASAGQAVIILGQRGAYSMFGLTPTTMTPPKQLADSRGVYGRAAARWRGENGQPGVIYLAADLNLWLAYAAEGVAGDAGGYVEEVSPLNKGVIADWLQITSATDPMTVSMVVDPIEDCVWIMKGTRAVVLRAPSLLDGNRPLELHEYAGAGWTHICTDPRRGVRLARGGGSIDSLERHPTTFAKITGSNIDGGLPMPVGHYTPARVISPRCLLRRVSVYRAAMANPVDITVTSTEKTATNYTIAANRRSVQLSQSQIGDMHDVRLVVPEGHAGIDKVELEIWMSAPNHP